MFAIVKHEYPQWDIPRVTLFDTIEEAKACVKATAREWLEDMPEGSELTVKEDGVFMDIDNSDPCNMYCQIVGVEDRR